MKYGFWVVQFRDWTYGYVMAQNYVEAGEGKEVSNVLAGPYSKEDEAREVAQSLTPHIPCNTDESLYPGYYEDMATERDRFIHAASERLEWLATVNKAMQAIHGIPDGSKAKIQALESLDKLYQHYYDLLDSES